MTFEKSLEASDSQIKNSDCSFSKFLQQLEYIFNIINQMCIGFITIYMTWLCMRNKLTGTSLHAWLVTFGFTFLMSEAIMCHYENNVLTFGFRRKTKTTIHWVLQLLGGGCGVAGIIVQLLKDKLPLFSVHGKLGFTVLILCIVSMCSGLVALCSGNMRRILSPLLNKTFHNFIGIATFALALGTQFTGYKMRLITKNAPIDFKILLQCVTLVALVLTCIGPLKALYRKIVNIIGRD